MTQPSKSTLVLEPRVERRAANAGELGDAGLGHPGCDRLRGEVPEDVSGDVRAGGVLLALSGVGLDLLAEGGMFVGHGSIVNHLTTGRRERKVIYMKNALYLNDQPVTVIGRENRHEVWVETADERVLRVFKAGLSAAPHGTVALSSLKVDNSRGTDGAR